MVFTASFLGAQHEKDGVKYRPANSLDVFLGKALHDTPLFLCGRPEAGPRSPLVGVA